jgi:hypothetical protein
MALVGIDLRSEFQEQAKLTYLHRLFHDIHTEEVVQDDALEHKISGTRVPIDPFQDSLEVLEFLGRVAFARPIKVRHESLHPIEACLV